MQLSELYGAMVEEESDELAVDRRLRQAHRPAAAPSRKDIEQDAKIREVERENLRLKGGLAALVHVLMEKGVMNEADVRQVIQYARRLVG